jgi:translation elongation factor EF-1alpha
LSPVMKQNGFGGESGFFKIIPVSGWYGDNVLDAKTVSPLKDMLSHSFGRKKTDVYKGIRSHNQEGGLEMEPNLEEEENAFKWYDGPSLLQMIDDLQLP